MSRDEMYPRREQTRARTSRPREEARVVAFAPDKEPGDAAAPVQRRGVTGNRALARLLQRTVGATDPPEPIVLNLHNLQRTIGNGAVASLVQRQAIVTEEQITTALRASKVPADLHKVGLDLIRMGLNDRAKSKKPELVQEGLEFLRTGRVQIRSMSVNLMAKPGFMGASVASLRRGEPVTLLDRADAWYRARKDDGKEGYLHANHFMPNVLDLRPGDTGSGSSRGEAEIGGRG